MQSEVLLLWTHKMLVLGITGLFVAVFILYALLVKPEYQSVAEIIPPSFKQIKSLNFLKSRFEGFGTAEEEDLERLVAALKSDTAFRFITTKFALEKHYDVAGISDPGRRMKALRSTYDSKITVKVSGLSTVQVTVYDEVPEMASDIANAFVDYAGDFVESIAQRKVGIVQIEKTIAGLEQYSQTLKDTMASYRSNYRLFHLDNMSETFAQQIAPYAFGKPGFTANYDNMLSGEHRLRYYDDMITSLINELAFRKENLATYPSMIDVVNKGLPSYVRARPKRLPIVLVGGIIGFIVAAGIVLIWKRKRP